MGKAEYFHNNLGNTLQENFGVRSEPVPVLPVPTDTGDQFQGRTRAKNAALIELDRILPDPDHQSRKHFSEQELKELADSLRENGQLQPVRVRWCPEKNVYVLLMGERRYRAAKLAGLTALECVVHDGPLTDDQRLELSLIENCVRQDLTPIEHAQALHALLDKKKCSMRDLAKSLHTTAATVSRALSLLKLSQDVQDHVAAGRIPAAVAREIAQLPSEAEQQEMVTRFFTEGLTSDAAAKAKVEKKSGATAASGGTTRKTITLAPGTTVVFTSKKKHANREIAAALRQAAEILESDGRSRLRRAG